MPTRRLRTARAASFFCIFSTLLLATGCDGTTDPPLPGATRLGAVLGSVDLSLTVFPVDTPAVSRPVGVGADGTPVGLALQGEIAAVPLGTVPAVAVVDVSAARLLRTIALPAGSGATGVAFLNDSVALVANPGLGSVSPVNVRAGTVGPEVSVGAYPQSVLSTGGRAYVVDANLVNFVPAGPGALVVLEGESPVVVDSIPLSGRNSAVAVAHPNGRIYVLHSGAFGGADGSLSVVDPSTGVELEHVEGFGDFPGSLAVGPGGRLHIGSFSYGLAVWDPSTESFVVPPESAVSPGDVAGVSGLAFDPAGGLWTLEPQCGEPAHAFRLDASLAIVDSVSVGICPTGIAFTAAEP